MKFSKMIFSPLLSIICSGMLMLISGEFNVDVPNSPCPKYFQYKFNGNDYFGEIILPSPPIQHREVILHITLSLRAATTVSYSILIKTIIQKNFSLLCNLITNYRTNKTKKNGKDVICGVNL